MGSIHDVIEAFRLAPSNSERGTKFEKLMVRYFELDHKRIDPRHRHTQEVRLVDPAGVGPQIHPGVRGADDDGDDRSERND